MRRRVRGNIVGRERYQSGGLLRVLSNAVKVHSGSGWRRRNKQQSTTANNVPHEILRIPLPHHQFLHLHLPTFASEPTSLRTNYTNCCASWCRYCRQLWQHLERLRARRDQRGPVPYGPQGRVSITPRFLFWGGALPWKAWEKE